jgi:Uma2 family endonuclease
MTIVQTKERIYTAQEYLELEIASETRNEYRNGEIIELFPALGNIYSSVSIAFESSIM